MVAMCGVVFGSQNRSEPATRASLDRAQELPFPGIAAVPGTAQGYPSPIGEDESGHVDRFGGGVGGSSLRHADIAAGVTAHRLDPDERAAEDLPRGTVHPVTRPAGEALRKRACHRTQIGQREPTAVACQCVDPHGGKRMAPRAVISVRQRRDRRACLRQAGKALPVGERCGGRGPDWPRIGPRLRRPARCFIGSFIGNDAAPSKENSAQKDRVAPPHRAAIAKSCRPGNEHVDGI